MRKKVIYIKKLNKTKVGKTIFGLVTIPAALTAIVDILHINRIIGDGWIHVLGIDTGNGHYYFFNDFIKLGNLKNIFLWIVFVACITLIAWQIFSYIKDNMQERLLVIEHNSLNQTKFVLSDEIKSEYNVKNLTFNQYDTFNINIPLEVKATTAITEVDLKANEIRKYISRGYSVAYAGIANIPATFMLGFELGDENTKKYLHKFHGEKTNQKLKDDKFHLLAEKTIRSTFDKEVLQESIDLSKDGNIVILISLTQPVKAPDYNAIVGDNDYVYKYSSSDDIDYDVIDSESQIESYSNKILSDIANIQKQKNIKQIRVCVAASGAFIFGLGTKFSKTQNKTTIIYHYAQNNYPWGINVTDKKIVIS